MVINGKTGAKSQYRKTTEKVTEKEETITDSKVDVIYQKSRFSGNRKSVPDYACDSPDYEKPGCGGGRRHLEISSWNHERSAFAVSAERYGGSCGIFMQKISEGKRIRIVGDYDIDGVCSTYLLYRGLTRVGAQVDYEIPDRIRDGYGINESIVEAAAADGIDTIVTCDNGIAAIEQMKLAKELGLTVVITDHHDILEIDGRQIVPEVDAVVNPKQAECQYPWKHICGAVVAYKLVQVLYEKYGVPDREWEEMVEFAAIATVGDVMRLQDENRIIVKAGLSNLPKTKSLGLRKLLEKNNLDPAEVSAYHIGFVIGPCLNAGGRLQTAKLALSLLFCEEEEQADQMALELKNLTISEKT